MKKIMFFLLLLLYASFCYAEEIPTDSIYPTTIGEMNATVTLYGQGTISELKTGEEVKFQTITFQNTPLQNVKIIKEELNIDGTIFYPKLILDKFGNKYASFVITKNGSFTYEIIADVNIITTIPEIIDSTIVEPSESLKQYTLASEKVESDSVEILNLTKNKLTSTDFIDTLNTTILWVNDYVEYAKGDEFNKYYLQQKTAVETLLNRKGVCDEFANLATAMLRAKNIPTKLAMGITYDGSNWGNHAWLEVYNEKQKEWIPSDPTFRETGFVDATHIKMGSFSDVSLSLAKATYPSTASISFDTQSKLPKVEIKKLKYFDLVTLSANEQEIKTNTWNEIKINIKNNTNRVLNVPISIKENYNEILFQEKKQTEILAPNETKEIIFKIYPTINLEENQIAKATLTFNSLSQPIKQNITLIKSKQIENGELIIEDITPIAHEGTLLIQIKAINYFNEDKQIDYNIISNSFSKTQTELIPKLSEKKVEIQINNYKNEEYLIKINTPTSIYSQTITTSQQTLIIPKPLEKQTVVEQKIDSTDTNSTEGLLLKNPLIVMVGILIVVGLILMGILWTNKRYV
jgi:hypothetical protein